MDCCKGLLHSLTFNIKHFFSSKINLGLLTLSCSKNCRDLLITLIYVVTVLTLPHTMPVFNAMQVQGDDLAPWGGWKHSCNLWWWQATVVSSFNALGIQATTEGYNWGQGESRIGSVRRSQNWLYSFSEYTPFRSWLWHYSFATISQGPEEFRVNIWITYLKSHLEKCLYLSLSTIN